MTSRSLLHPPIAIVPITLVLLALAPAAAEPLDDVPTGQWIASSEKIDFFRVMPGLELEGLVNGMSCAETTGYDRGRLRADCKIERDEADYRARLTGRFKLDLRHKRDAARIVVRAEMKGYLKEVGGGRSDLSITLKGGKAVKAGRNVAVVPLTTKACVESACAKGHVSLAVPVENATGRWTLELNLDPAVDYTISGSAVLRFADAEVVSWSVLGGFDGSKARSKMVLVPDLSVRGRALSLAKIVPSDDGLAGKLIYNVFGQSGKTRIALVPAPQLTLSQD